uniref:50S ribosomal protein L11, chloroplastic n=1 Tax=Cyanidium sp. THAL103 TaxID=3027999 RepID=A0A9Y1I487_9RHOD|nr:ribosomal protein L11 [Cyanidium sp. THAL103]
MAKKIIALIKLALPAGKANPAPPVGPALGQHGVNIMMFTKEYNSRTVDKIGSIIPVEISVYEDKSFSFILKTPPASVLIKEILGIKKGSKTSKSQIVGSINYEQLVEIAKVKLIDLNTDQLEKATRIIEGTARNMGILFKQ